MIFIFKNRSLVYYELFSLAKMEITSEQLTTWLRKHHAVQSQLNLIVTGLRRRKLLGSLPCAKATLEILRTLIGSCKFTTTFQMMATIRAIARELINAAPSELAIGNIVKRLLFLIREEYDNKLKFGQKLRTLECDIEIKEPEAIAPRQTSILHEYEALKRSINDVSEAEGDDDTDKLINGDITCDEGTDKPEEAIDSRHSMPSTEVNTQIFPPPLDRMLSAGSVLCAPTSASAALNVETNSTDKFSRIFSDTRQSVMAAIAEINEEMDNLYAPICDQAQEHIHADECVLVFGYSSLVEAFLKAAARKRRFHVIISEASPLSTGIKLANSLSKISTVSITLIPDSNVYAIMSRVNKVIIAPHAVMMDGGCMCTAGHLLTAIAAKEYAVPVVCVAGTYILTPLFAHNQKLALGQLLSPALIFPYDATVYSDNVEVFVPAFDHLSPDLVDILVTNNGTHLPSYVYRLLEELYNFDDYTL